MLPFLGANGFRAYAPDRPGYGLADTREEHWPRYGFFSQVDFVHQFADALCLDRFHLAGNSMGAVSTALYVCEHPERIIRFIVIAGVTFGWVPGTPRPQGDRRGAVLREFDGTEESMRVLMEPIIYRKVAISPELLRMRTMSALKQKASESSFREFNRKTMEDPNSAQRYNIRGRLEKLTLPALYIHGKQDVLSPVENAYENEAILTGIQFFYPEECGHQAQTDQPEMVNQLFLEFFRDGKVSRKTADWAGVSRRRPENPGLVEQLVGVSR
jgi:pimeloyl-ACP methyl ester carboxylesterase